MSITDERFELSTADYIEAFGLNDLEVRAVGLGPLRYGEGFAYYVSRNRRGTVKRTNLTRWVRGCPPYVYEWTASDYPEDWRTRERYGKYGKESWCNGIREE